MVRVQPERVNRLTGRDATRAATSPPAAGGCELFGFHQIGEDVVNPGEVARALRFEPGEDARVEAEADRHSRRFGFTQPDHGGKLGAAEGRDVAGAAGGHLA